MLEEIILKQREYFKSGKTLDLNARLSYLKRLKLAVKENEKLLYEALKADLGKSEPEAYMCEVGMVLEELSYHIRHFKKWAKRKRKSSPLAQFPSESFILPSPYGCTLIISPWNYPFLLSFQPLIGAISAGNTVFLKPSRLSANTSKVMKSIVESVFPEEYAAVGYEGENLSRELLKHKFDYIFFTGGVKTGQSVYAEAAKQMTPVTLELGGKSPAIIDGSANIRLAAKRIAFGKFLNAGQTCVAPDYAIVHESVAEKFAECLKKQIETLYPDSLNNENYCKIISQKHFERIKNLLGGNIYCGGKYSESLLKIEPTVIFPAGENDACMQEEIFGPVLPIIVYRDEEEIFSIIDKHPSPLALYLFTNKKSTEREFLSRIRFGGGCVNDTVIHLASQSLPFGGVGNSGIGSYHGKKSFETFSHYKSVLKKSNSIDLPVRYSPYTKFKYKLIKFFMK